MQILLSVEEFKDLGQRLARQSYKVDHEAGKSIELPRKKRKYRRRANRMEKNEQSIPQATA